MRMSMMISMGHPTITLIIEIRFLNLTSSLCTHLPWMQWACGYRIICARQPWKYDSGPLKWLLRWHNPSILRVTRSIMSQRRWMNDSLRCWHSRWYYIKCSNNWICPLMYISTGGMIQTSLVSNGLHGKLKICANLSLLLKTLQASLLVQNTMPRQRFQVFRW